MGLFSWGPRAGRDGKQEKQGACYWQ